MNVFDTNRDDTDDFDLLTLNSYVLLDTLRRKREETHRQILVQWDKCQGLGMELRDRAIE